MVKVEIGKHEHVRPQLSRMYCTGKYHGAKDARSDPCELIIRIGLRESLPITTVGCGQKLDSSQEL